MGLLRNRGPYAPVRKGPAPIDWPAHEAASARERAKVAAIEDEVRRARTEETLEANPIHQLTKRCYVIEQRQDAFDRRLGLLEERVDVIIGLLSRSSP